jgi:hypothetical protein
LSGVERVTNLPFQSNKFIVEVSETSEIPSKRALGKVSRPVRRSFFLRHLVSSPMSSCTGPWRSARSRSTSTRNMTLRASLSGHPSR